MQRSFSIACALSGLLTGCALPPIAGAFATDKDSAAVVYDFGTSLPAARTTENDFYALLVKVDGGGVKVAPTMDVLSNAPREYWITPGKHALQVRCGTKNFLIGGEGGGMIEVELARGKTYQLSGTATRKWYPGQRMYRCTPSISAK